MVASINNRNLSYLDQVAFQHATTSSGLLTRGLHKSVCLYLCAVTSVRFTVCSCFCSTFRFTSLRHPRSKLTKTPIDCDLAHSFIGLHHLLWLHLHAIQQLIYIQSKILMQLYNYPNLPQTTQLYLPVSFTIYIQKKQRT